MSVQTFCTSLKRPERAAHAAAWARVRRLAGAHDGHAGSPSAGAQERIGPRRRQVHRWLGLGSLAGCRPGRPGRRGQGPRRAAGRVTAVERRGWRRAVCRAAPHPSRALRVASDGHKPAALEQASLCGPRAGVVGRPMACPHRGAHRQPRHRLLFGVARGVNRALTPVRQTLGLYVWQADGKERRLRWRGNIVVHKYVEVFGDGSSEEFVVTHSLNTQDVIVSVFSNEAPFDVVINDVSMTSATEVTLRFDRPPTKAEYRVVVIG